MSDRLTDLENRLIAVERRLSQLEGAAYDPPQTAGIAQDAAVGDGFLSNASTLIGRILLIFGGAYLLRAITEFDVVPTAIGIAMGAGYALFWLYMAYRKGGDDSERTTALFYGGASVLLAMPLLVEASGRFALLSGSQGVFALSVLALLALVVAAARNMKLLGWLVTAGGIATALVILRLTRNTIPVATFLIFLGVLSLWICNLREWRGPQWLGALGANGGVLAVALLSTSEQWAVEPLSAFLLGTLLLGAYLVSIGVQTHWREYHVRVFEAVQTLLAIGVVFATASIASRAGQLQMAIVGVCSLLLAGGSYLLAFGSETRKARGRNFYYYSSLGLLLLVLGSALVTSPKVAAAAWSLLALGMAWFSGRFARVSLSLQCTFLLIAAGISSGILDLGIRAFVGDAVTAWPEPVVWHIVVALTTVACLFIPVAQHSDRWGVMAGLPQLIVLGLSVWAVGGLMVVYMAPFFASAGGQEVDAAVLAALRTVVLGTAAVTLAISSRFKRWPEARWLVYPVLAVVGIKLFIEDFPNGQPVTLFVALAVVGSALIVVARLLRRETGATDFS